MSSNTGRNEHRHIVSSSMTPNYYDILKIDLQATEEEIKKSYRELVQIWHPDLNRSNARAAEHKIQVINEAYSQLINSQSRSRYDQMLKRQRQKLTAHNENNNLNRRDTSSSLLKQFLAWLKVGDQNGR